MNEEAGFLASIRKNPAEETARLAYADWLDEQGDPVSTSKAVFIRLELRMAELPEKSLNRVRLLSKLQKLAADLDPAWLAVVSHPKLEACRFAFEFECPKQWERLAPTGKDNVRFCESCEKKVYYCDTVRKARMHATQGHCVALSLGLIRRPGDLRPVRPGFERRTLGRVFPPGYRRTVRLGEVPPPTPPAEPAGDPGPPSKSQRKKNRNRNLPRETREECE